MESTESEPNSFLRQGIKKGFKDKGRSKVRSKRLWGIHYVKRKKNMNEVLELFIKAA